jgi:succinyl-CoA synthetase alpha subunit
VVEQLKKAGLGQSTCIILGGDPVNGTNFIDVLSAFENDDSTSRVVMVGEIGGSAEEGAAVYINTTCQTLWSALLLA